MLSFGSSQLKVCKYGTQCIKFHKPIKVTLTQRLHEKGPSSEVHWPKSTIVLEFPMHCWATQLLKRQRESSRIAAIFMSIKLADSDNITGTALLRKITLFFPLMVAMKYKILTGTGSQDGFPKAIHPTMWCGWRSCATKRGSHSTLSRKRPPEMQSVYPVCTGCLHAQCFPRRLNQREAKKSTFTRHLVSAFQPKLLFCLLHSIPMKPLSYVLLFIFFTE